jgi:hypothetical protein
MAGSADRQLACGARDPSLVRAAPRALPGDNHGAPTSFGSKDVPEDDRPVLALQRLDRFVAISGVDTLASARPHREGDGGGWDAPSGGADEDPSIGARRSAFANPKMKAAASHAHSGFPEDRHALVADPVARLVLQPLRLRLNDEPATSDAVAAAPRAPANQTWPSPDDRDLSEHFWVGNDLRCGIHRLLRPPEESLIQAILVGV